ncbi:MAG: choice-of-anchor J domain-containing protein [Bacteroidales bacterium]|nr:choice-of-anchor J domain-containing protein [Bacteroidales bacterium]
MKKIFTLFAILFAVVAVNAQTEFTYDFENDLQGWTVLTVNADGGQWLHSSNQPNGYDYSEIAHSGTGFALCYSFVDYDGPYNTDSYLVSPQMFTITSGSTMTFYADNANDSYPENISVAVSTAATPTAADFTSIWEGSAKDGEKYENWRSHSIDLSSYAGQTIWIAFHDVNEDAYEIWIDDVTINAIGTGINQVSNTTFSVYPNPATSILNVEGEGLAEVYNALGQMVISENVNGTAQLNVNNLESGVYFVRMNGATQRFIKK